MATSPTWARCILLAAASNIHALPHGGEPNKFTANYLEKDRGFEVAGTVTITGNSFALDELARPPYSALKISLGDCLSISADAVQAQPDMSTPGVGSLVFSYTALLSKEQGDKISPDDLRKQLANITELIRTATPFDYDFSAVAGEPRIASQRASMTAWHAHASISHEDWVKVSEGSSALALRPKAYSYAPNVFPAFPGATNMAHTFQNLGAPLPGYLDKDRPIPVEPSLHPFPRPSFGRPGGDRAGGASLLKSEKVQPCICSAAYPFCKTFDQFCYASDTAVHAADEHHCAGRCTSHHIVEPMRYASGDGSTLPAPKCANFPGEADEVMPHIGRTGPHRRRMTLPPAPAAHETLLVYACRLALKVCDYAWADSLIGRETMLRGIAEAVGADFSAVSLLEMAPVVAYEQELREAGRLSQNMQDHNDERPLFGDDEGAAADGWSPDYGWLYLDVQINAPRDESGNWASSPTKFRLHTALAEITGYQTSRGLLYPTVARFEVVEPPKPFLLVAEDGSFKILPPGSDAHHMARSDGEDIEEDQARPRNAWMAHWSSVSAAGTGAAQRLVSARGEEMESTQAIDRFLLKMSEFQDEKLAYARSAASAALEHERNAEMLLEAASQADTLSASLTELLVRTTVAKWIGMVSGARVTCEQSSQTTLPTESSWTDEAACKSACDANEDCVAVFFTSEPQSARPCSLFRRCDAIRPVDHPGDTLIKADYSYVERSSACTAHEKQITPGTHERGTTFRCLDGLCINTKGKCNGISNCDDGSDEDACGEFESQQEEQARAYKLALTNFVEVDKQRRVKDLRAVLPATDVIMSNSRDAARFLFKIFKQLASLSTYYDRKAKELEAPSESSISFDTHGVAMLRELLDEHIILNNTMHDVVALMEAAVNEISTALHYFDDALTMPDGENPYGIYDTLRSVSLNEYVEHLQLSLKKALTNCSQRTHSVWRTATRSRTKMDELLQRFGELDKFFKTVADEERMEYQLRVWTTNETAFELLQNLTKNQQQTVALARLSEEASHTLAADAAAAERLEQSALEVSGQADLVFEGAAPGVVGAGFVALNGSMRRFLNGERLMPRETSLLQSMYSRLESAGSVAALSAATLRDALASRLRLLQELSGQGRSSSQPRCALHRGRQTCESANEYGVPCACPMGGSRRRVSRDCIMCSKDVRSFTHGLVNAQAGLLSATTHALGFAYALADVAIAVQNSTAGVAKALSGRASHISARTKSEVDAAAQQLMQQQQDNACSWNILAAPSPVGKIRHFSWTGPCSAKFSLVSTPSEWCKQKFGLGERVALHSSTGNRLGALSCSDTHWVITATPTKTCEDVDQEMGCRYMGYCKWNSTHCLNNGAEYRSRLRARRVVELAAAGKTRQRSLIVREAAVKEAEESRNFTRRAFQLMKLNFNILQEMTQMRHQVRSISQEVAEEANGENQRFHFALLAMPSKDEQRKFGHPLGHECLPDGAKASGIKNQVGNKLGVQCCDDQDAISRPQCRTEATYNGAKRVCTQAGLQLCTRKQIRDGEQTGLACDKFDSFMVWTSDECYVTASLLSQEHSNDTSLAPSLILANRLRQSWGSRRRVRSSDTGPEGNATSVQRGSVFVAEALRVGVVSDVSVYEVERKVYTFIGCNVDGEWNRSYGSVPLTVTGVDVCMLQCLAGGYAYGGFECPVAGNGSAQNDGTVQCLCAQKVAINADPDCAIPQGHCNGGSVIGGYRMGANGVRSVYRLRTGASNLFTTTATTPSPNAANSTSLHVVDPQNKGAFERSTSSRAKATLAAEPISAKVFNGTASERKADVVVRKAVAGTQAGKLPLREDGTAPLQRTDLQQKSDNLKAAPTTEKPPAALQASALGPSSNTRRVADNRKDSDMSAAHDGSSAKEMHGPAKHSSEAKGQPAASLIRREGTASSPRVESPAASARPGTTAHRVEPYSSRPNVSLQQISVRQHSPRTHQGGKVKAAATRGRPRAAIRTNKTRAPVRQTFGVSAADFSSAKADGEIEWSMALLPSCVPQNMFVSILLAQTVAALAVYFVCYFFIVAPYSKPTDEVSKAARLQLELDRDSCI